MQKQAVSYDFRGSSVCFSDSSYM